MMTENVEKKRLDILKILNTAANPVNSRDIAHHLLEIGYDISERTVRFDLLSLDNEGFTNYIRKKGRIITEKGRKELSKARIYEKVGFLSSKIDRMTYRMKFDLASPAGTVVLNLSIIEERFLAKAYPMIQKVFETRYSMGKLMTMFVPGEDNGVFDIPEGCIGIGTVCSITLNGILLSHGIPVRSRFGGLLEIRDHQPNRFVAIINYDGTSLDPLEIFIKSELTDYHGAVSGGNGIIGASFKEMPGESRNQVKEIVLTLKDVGLDGFLKIGYPGKPLCEIPVNDGTFGAVIMGGLNPIAILEESGIKIQSKALSGLADFSRLFNYEEFAQRLRGYDLL